MTARQDGLGIDVNTRLNEYAHYLAYMITETLQISYLIKHKETQQVNKIGTRQ